MKKVVNVKDNREMKPKGKELIGPEKRRPGAKTLVKIKIKNIKFKRVIDSRRN